MKKIEKRPFRPCVTVEQIGAFDASRPETFTGEVLVDAVLTVFCEAGAISMQKMGECMELLPARLSAALEVLTGYNYSDFRMLWLHARFEQLKAEHPDWGPDALAHGLGFYDRSALWRMFHRNKRKQEYADQQSYSRMSRAEQDEYIRNMRKAYEEKLGL